MTDLKELIEQLRDFGKFIRDSQGVAGYHLNGDIEPWGDLETLPDEAADALEADKCAVVKPLEWIHCSDGTMHDAHCQYEIEFDGGFWRVTKGVTGGGSYVADANSEKSAKAAAQSDYERRILSTITIRPAAEVFAEAQWDAFNRVLHWINEQDKKIMSKGDLYDAVMEMRPREIDALHTDATRAAMKRKGDE